MVDYSKYLIFVIAAVALIIAILGVTGVTNIPTGGNETKKECTFPEYVCTVGVAIGIPEGWLRSDTIIWYFIIPIMGVWMIIYGFLDRIRIFRSSISGILALFIAFSMIPLGIFVIIVSLLFSVMGVYSVVMFVALFFVGTYLYSKGLFFGWKGYTGAYDQAILAQEKLKGELSAKLRDIVNETYDAQHLRGRYAGPGATLAVPRIQALQTEALEVRKQIAACDAQIEHFKRTKGASKKVWKRLEKT